YRRPQPRGVSECCESGLCFHGWQQSRHSVTDRSSGAEAPTGQGQRAIFDSFSYGDRSQCGQTAWLQRASERYTVGIPRGHGERKRRLELQLARPAFGKILSKREPEHQSVCAKQRYRLSPESERGKLGRFAEQYLHGEADPDVGATRGSSAPG